MMAFKSRTAGFFYEYKKNRPRMLLDKEPKPKKTWFETFMENREKEELEKKKAKEKAELKAQADEAERARVEAELLR